MAERTTDRGQIEVHPAVKQQLKDYQTALRRHISRRASQGEIIGALLSPIAPAATVAIAWVNGWLAAYLAACARLVGGLPGAQIRSPVAALLLLAGALLVAAYASGRKCRLSSSPST